MDPRRSLRWRVAILLVAALLCSLLDQGEGFHVRIFSQTGQRVCLASGVYVKKIEDEESTIKKKSEGGKKTKSESNWREKQRQKELVPMSSASAEDAFSSPAASLMEVEVEVDDDVPHAQESKEVMEPIMASDLDAAATLQFIDAMKSGVDSLEALFDGPGSSGSKERADRDRQREEGQRMNPMDGVLRVPKKDPMSGGVLPPEVVFFGEPRKPPPVATAGRVEYHSTLLMWARHGNFVPRDSVERLRSVFPKGAQEKAAERLRLSPVGLSYGLIYSAWTAVMEDLEEAKRFIAVNLDLVPPKMFLRAITAKKLAAQSRGDVPEMRSLMHVRSKYILASDQLFFPLNIERLKAETRVMTYLARDELRTFSAPWDEVECSLHMTSLMAARLHWDRRAEIKLEQIKEVVANTVEYMREKTYNNLMTTVFRKPALTSQTYTNASVNIMTLMPALYAKVAPEVKVLHETYEMVREGRIGDVRRHVEGVVCPREGLSLEELKLRLRLFDATVSNIQGVDYIKVQRLCADVHRALCSEAEAAALHQWYTDHLDAGYGFETYQPDEIPQIIKDDQRQRDTGNAFTDFWVQVMKQPTLYTPAFAGVRKSGLEVGNWLQLDETYQDFEGLTDDPDERLEDFRRAYTEQMRARLEDESRLDRIVVSRLDELDRVLGGSSKLVASFGDEEGG